MQRRIYIYKYILWAMILGCLPLLCACGSDVEDDIEDSGMPIGFVSSVAEQGQGMTRAGTALASDFTVIGYKCKGSTESEVFPKYLVEYDNNKYNYVGVNNQTIKYWDTAATEYRFWGYTGTEWTISNSDRTLTIDNRQLRVGKTGDNVEHKTIDDNLFASLECVAPSVYDLKVPVELCFNRPFSQVSLYFYYDVMKPGVSSMKIKNIKLSPANGVKIYTKGSVVVTYPLSGTDPETVSVTGTNEQDTSPCLDFLFDSELKGDVGHGVSNAIQAEIPNSIVDGLELPNMPGVSLGTRATGDDAPYKFYYTLPMGSQNPDFELSLYLEELDSSGNLKRTVPRVATIPSTYMQWKPNYAYRYFIKISDSTLAFDVTIDPWTSGGSQDDEWKNW